MRSNCFKINVIGSDWLSTLPQSEFQQRLAEVETDAHRLAQRLKQIDMGKNTLGCVLVGVVTINSIYTAMSATWPLSPSIPAPPDTRALRRTLPS